MPNYRQAIQKIKNPENIHEAVYASGPNALMKAFLKDRTVQLLIRGRSKAFPLVARELEKGGMELDEITRSCFAFILQRIDLASAAKVLQPLFVEAMKAPDPFFIYFASHALRQHLALPVDPSDPLQSRGELLETLDRLTGQEVA